MIEDVAVGAPVTVPNMMTKTSRPQDAVAPHSSRTAPERPLTVSRPHPHRLSRASRIAAAIAGTVLVATANMTLLAGAANAGPVDDLLEDACRSYVPNPDPAAVPPRVSDCSGAVLTRANLTGANLAGANLDDANLNYARLDNAQLTDASLVDANLSNSTATSANLEQANLYGARLIWADLTSANLAGATLTSADVRNAKLNNAKLNRVSLNSAELSGADLSGADLTSASLGNAYLLSTVFTGATLTSATLEGARTTDTARFPFSSSHPSTSPDGATVTWTVPPMPTGLSFGACTPASGHLFPIGRTQVRCIVTSQVGATTTQGAAVFAVSVTSAPQFVDPPTEPLTAVANTAFTPLTFTATGFPTPSITVVDPAQLPPGMTVTYDPGTNGSTLSGTPTTPGTYTFTLTANGAQPNDTLDVTVIVATAPGFIDPPTEPLTAVADTAFTPLTFTATGYPAPSITVVDPAQLPPGMSVTYDPDTGALTLSGTPTTPGTYTFTLTATNGTQPDDTLDVTITVDPAPADDPPATGSLAGSLGRLKIFTTGS